MRVLYRYKSSVVMVALIAAVLLDVFRATNARTLQYSSAFSLRTDVTKTISDIVSQFRQYSSLCIVSQHQELANVFTRLCKNENKTVILKDSMMGPLEECDTVVVIEMNSTADCPAELNEVSRPSFYFLQDLALDVARVGRCLTAMLTAEVVVFSLSDRVVFELSPKGPGPRFLSRSSLGQVGRHRSQPRVTDLRGMAVTAATLEDSVFVLTKGQDNSDKFDGVLVMLVKELASKLNFSLRFNVYSGLDGHMSEDGHFTRGIGFAMQEGHADLAVCDVLQVLPFYHVVDFGPSLDKLTIRFLVRRPEQLDFQWWVFVTIFQPEVWLATLVSSVLVVTVYRTGINWDIHIHRESWSGSLLTVTGYFLLTSSHSRCTESNSRYTLSGWSVFSLLLTASLSTGIVTRLLLPSYSPRIDTVRQLVEGQYYWTVQYYNQYENEEAKSIFFDFGNQWQRLFEKKYKYMEPEEVEEKARTDIKITFPVQSLGDNFVIIDTYGLGGHKDLKKFRVSKEDITSNHLSFAFKKHSPLLEPLTVQTLKFLEAGLFKHWLDGVCSRWPNEDTRHLLKEQDMPTLSEPQSLRLKRAQPVFYLLLSGLAIAFFVFIIETIW